MASVETFVAVSPGLRDDPFRWQRCLDQARRILAARIPSGRRVDAELTFGIVEYPPEPTMPGHKLYRFVLAHRASEGRPDDGSEPPVTNRALAALLA